MEKFNILLSRFFVNFLMHLGLKQEQREKVIYFLNRIRYPQYNVSLKKNKEIIKEFTKLFYNQSILGGMWNSSRWFGIKIFKNPLDLFVYQEIIFEVKPDVIVETGTAYGGSALFLASILDLLSKGKVLTIEINRHRMPQHKRIKYFYGSSTDPEIVRKIKSRIKKGDKVLVILDSDHKREHVLEEMQIYSKLVSVGSYLIVEDTNINGHPILEDFGPGPYEAVQSFLKKNMTFKVDQSREKFLLTSDPKGFLKKIKF